jgi:hypothetical protein
MSMSSFSALIRTRKNSRPVLGARNRHVERHARPFEMGWAQRSRRNRDQPDALARRQRRLHPGHLHQRRGRDGNADGSRNLTLEQREEAAIGRDRLRAEADEIPGCLDEIRQQASGTLHHHLVGARAGHHAIQHRERPGRTIAHIPEDAGKARLQHQDAEWRAIDRLAAARDAAGRRRRGS